MGDETQSCVSLIIKEREVKPKTFAETDSLLEISSLKQHLCFDCKDLHLDPVRDAWHSPEQNAGRVTFSAISVDFLGSCPTLALSILVSARKNLARGEDPPARGCRKNGRKWVCGHQEESPGLAQQGPM